MWPDATSNTPLYSRNIKCCAYCQLNLFLLKIKLMNHHEKTDKQVVFAQLLCFLFATLLGLIADVFDKEGREIVFKLVDSIFITGTILVAMKMAREGWDMTAAGYTLLSIAWGVFFLAKDFQEQRVGDDILASSFYFLLPSMILISFYTPFPLFIKIIGLLTIIPSLIGLILIKTKAAETDYLIWRRISYQAVHITSLFWGFFFLWQYRKSLKKVQPESQNL